MVAVTGGHLHSLAVKSDGTVMAWGYGADGELGNGGTSNSSLPVRVSSLQGAVSISGGTQHSLAIRSDGTGWAWGGGFSGQLGTGGMSNSSVPVQVSGLSRGAAVAAGDGHSLAVLTDGTVQGWGSDTFGEIGPNGGLGVTKPVPAGVSGIGRITSYGYDGNGLRSAKSDLVNRNNFVWDQSGPLPLLLQDASGSYIYGPGGQPVEQIDSAGIVTYFHQDQLGSTRLLTDGSGNVAATYTYDAYGNLTSRTGTVTTPLQFAGEYTDAETGFQYLRARYYDPATAQFLARDPAVMQTRSAYGYVGGNPLNRTDPTGALLCKPLARNDARGCMDPLTDVAKNCYDRSSCTAVLNELQDVERCQIEMSQDPWIRRHTTPHEMVNFFLWVGEVHQLRDAIGSALASGTKHSFKEAALEAAKEEFEEAIIEGGIQGLATKSSPAGLLAAGGMAFMSGVSWLISETPFVDDLEWTTYD